MPAQLGASRARYYDGFMLRRLSLAFRLTLALLLALVLIAPDWPAFGDDSFRFQAIVGQEYRFDFLQWTLRSLGMKAQAALAGTHDYLPEEAGRASVMDYLDEIARARALEAAIARVYADPDVSDPAAATADQQAEVAAVRRDLAWRQPLAEAIVQSQVAAELQAAGLGHGGMVWPPVFMTMTPTPYMLIVSPRDRIAQVNYASLVPGLPVEVQEQLETAVFERLDLSALVVPIGGLGTYPAMITETSSIDWLTRVTAHEWTHHWLAFRPLGVRYLSSPQMRAINETVASLVEREIGPEVIARYYPERLAAAAPPVMSQPDAPAFDYRAELAVTRDEVDRLLAEGRIEEAEAYMEQRRQLFVQNGYAIRKMNQAFFAFYGGYAAEPGGAAGADPVGPMLRDLREASPSLSAFLSEVAGITSYEDLLTRHRAIVGDEAAILE